MSEPRCPAAPRRGRSGKGGKEGGRERSGRSRRNSKSYKVPRKQNQENNKHHGQQKNNSNLTKNTTTTKPPTEARTQHQQPDRHQHTPPPSPPASQISQTPTITNTNENTTLHKTREQNASTAVSAKRHFHATHRSIDNLPPLPPRPWPSLHPASGTPPSNSPRLSAVAGTSAGVGDGAAETRLTFAGRTKSPCSGGQQKYLS